METFVFFLKIIFGILFLFAGIMHVIKPKFFKYFTPPFLPLKLTNYIIGVIEFMLGLGLFFSNTTKIASITIFVLMIFFLPIHLWDFTKVKPAIGSKTIALVRIPIQFLFMYISYLIYCFS